MRLSTMLMEIRTFATCGYLLDIKDNYMTISSHQFPHKIPGISAVEFELPDYKADDEKDIIILSNVHDSSVENVVYFATHIPIRGQKKLFANDPDKYKLVIFQCEYIVFPSEDGLIYQLKNNNLEIPPEAKLRSKRNSVIRNNKLTVFNFKTGNIFQDDRTPIKNPIFITSGYKLLAGDTDHIRFNFLSPYITPEQHLPKTEAQLPFNSIDSELEALCWQWDEEDNF